MADSDADEIPQSREQKLADAQKRVDAMRQSKAARMVDRQDIPDQDKMAEKFNARADAFFSGDYDALLREERRGQRREEVRAQAETKNDEPTGVAPVKVNPEPIDIIEDESEAVKIYHPTKVSAWDKAREKEIAAEKRLSEVDEGTPEHAIAKRLYDEALRLRKIEDARDSDPKYRQWRSNDIWRAGEGKEEYNASRRHSPRLRANLSEMTQEQKAEHKRAKEREKKARQRAAKKAAVLTGGSKVAGSLL